MLVETRSSIQRQEKSCKSKTGGPSRSKTITPIILSSKKLSLQTEFVDNDNKQTNQSEARCNSEEKKSSLRREKMCYDKKLKNARDESGTINVNAISNSSHLRFFFTKKNAEMAQMIL